MATPATLDAHLVRPPTLDAHLIRPAASVSASAAPLHHPQEEAGRLSMAEVVVGIMTCRRFHRTRCRAQSDTWLRRARRVVFFTDFADGAADELRAPAIAHAFVPSETERIFSGGNWRAVPILRALAEGFFAPRAQEAMRARSEPVPSWVYMADDDSFAFTPELLATLEKLNPDEHGPWRLQPLGDPADMTYHGMAWHSRARPVEAPTTCEPAVTAAPLSR